MMNNKNHTEDFIKELVQNSELQSPSDGFTDNIMSKLQTEAQVEMIKPDSTFNIWQWLLIVVPSMILVGGTFYYYRQDFATMFSSEYITNSFIPYIQDLFGKGSDIMSKQEVSPILIIVIISGAFLMIIDRFVQFGRRMKSYIFTF